jgi:hypothetical protein
MMLEKDVNDAGLMKFGLILLRLEVEMPTVDFDVEVTRL